MRPLCFALAGQQALEGTNWSTSQISVQRKANKVIDVASKTDIEWTDFSWNVLRGCSRISEGCRNCYAEVVANRFKEPGLPYEGLITKTGQWNGQVRVIEKLMDQPLRWRKPRRIFVNSMSDIFHENVDDYTIRRIFDVMAQAKQHTFQILTKRVERMHQLLSLWDQVGITGEHFHGHPLKNVWLGVSAEDQATADERIPLLLQTPAVVRWLSIEPLLGPVDLTALPSPDISPNIRNRISETGRALKVTPRWQEQSYLFLGCHNSRCFRRTTPSPIVCQRAGAALLNVNLSVMKAPLSQTRLDMQNCSTTELGYVACYG